MSIIKAGIIPCIKKDKQLFMLFMKPSDPKFGGPDYQIAKGHIDKDESPLQAAIREGYEELGLKPTNIDHVWPVGIVKNTKVYACEVYSMKDFDQPDYETGSTRWMTPNEFLETGRHMHRGIVRAAARKLKLLESFPELRTVIW